MLGKYTCTRPLDTVSRVMDTARRMGLEVTWLGLAKNEGDRFSLGFSLATDEAHRIENFLQRIDHLQDLYREIGNV